MSFRRARRWLSGLLVAAGAASCSTWEGSASDSGSGGEIDGNTGGEAGADSVPLDYPRGLRVEGNRIVDREGNRIVLRGVNRSGTEYECTKGRRIFDGAFDDASVRAMKRWNVNAVRVPLNEACWLGISGAPTELSGELYKQAILDYVGLLHRHALVPILDLHWAAPGGVLPDDTNQLLPMPNADHSPAFWTDVAATFLDDDAVVFEPFNEPFPDSNRDTNAAWQCWRDGCTVSLRRPLADGSTTYEAAGMQALVDAIRATGSEHVVLLGGVQYSNGLTRWMDSMPVDPTGQLGAAWHVYDNNPCRNASCWDDVPAELLAAVPVVVTELGQRDCAGEFIKPLMEWLDMHDTGYLAWTWNTAAQCSPETATSRGAPWALITDYLNPEPTGGYARTLRDHLLAAAP